MKIYSKQVLALINAFSPDGITCPFDRDQFYVNLQRIKDKFLEATNWMAGTIVDLKTNNEEERIYELEKLLKDVRRKMK